MQNHLQQHNFDHAERMERAERERLAQELQAEGTQPNVAMLKLGELMVSVGEQLQQRAHPKQRPRRA